MAAYGQAVSRLQRFIDEVTGHSAEPCPPGLNSSSSPSSRRSSEPPFRTYQAFVWALYRYFSSFKEELSAIERDIISKGESHSGLKGITVFTLLTCFSPLFAGVMMM